MQLFCHWGNWCTTKTEVSNPKSSWWWNQNWKQFRAFSFSVSFSLSPSASLSLLSFHFGYNIPGMESVLLLNIHLFFYICNYNLEWCDQGTEYPAAQQASFVPFPSDHPVFHYSDLAPWISFADSRTSLDVAIYVCSSTPSFLCESMFLLTDGSCFIVQMYHDVFIHFPKSWSVVGLQCCVNFYCCSKVIQL